MADEAKQYAARNRQGSSWFSHDAGSSPAASSKSAAVQSPVVSESVASPTKNGEPCSSDRAQMIKPTSNSNDWFKYDHAESTQKSVKTEDKQAPVVVSKEVEQPAAEKPPPSKVSDDAMANNNQQKSKAGSSSDWFSHDHPEGTASDAAHKHGATKELGANAARMRGESEHWFSHDHTAGDSAAAVAPPAKGRFGRQAAPDNMRDIFHHAGADSK